MGKPYKIEPFPARLENRGRLELTVEIPSDQGQNCHEVEIHEWIGEIGFHYEPHLRTKSYMRDWAPRQEVRGLAQDLGRIFRELNIGADRIVIGLRERTMAQQLFGISGHEGWVIVGLDGSVYVEVEVGYSRATADHIKAVLWHEAMHVKYAFERRWPTAWPFRSQSDPTGVLQALLHFSLDGWLDRHGKPKICSKADRMRELRDQLELHGSALGEKTVNPIAEDLWQRDTDVCDVWRIMKSLGLEVEAGATWGQYLLSASE